MNSAKKAKRLDAVPRVRKRNSTYKPDSHNAVQGRASLLKNNKTLAVTLQETRCELSNYKTFFEESLECISKVKIAKSKMVQLSTALKDFVKAFDDTLFSMEFDDSKWTNFKISPQSCKSFENEMNPVLEVADEVLHHNRSCEEENINTNSECSTTDRQVEVVQGILQREKDDDDLKKVSFQSSQKETDSDCYNLNDMALALDSEIGKAKGNVDMKTEVHKLDKQTVKSTKIPRCKNLSVNLKSQKELKPRNNACKRKSPGKKGEMSESNFSRRKTFVVKSSNILANSELKDNLLQEDVETKNLVSVNEMVGIPQDALILKKKRKTFVKKSSLKGSVFAANLNDIQDDELVIKNDKRKTFVKKSILKDSAFASNLNDIQDMDSEININKGTVIQDDELVIKNDKRKTFVKKSSNTTVPNQNNDYHTIFPNKECTSVDSEFTTTETENCENNEESKNLRPSSLLQSHMPHSEMDDIVCKNRGEIEDVPSLNIYVASAKPSEEVKEEDKIIIVNEPPSSENNKEQNVMKNMASETSSQEMNESNKMPTVNEPSSSENQTEQHAMKTTIFRGCLELSDSDCEEIPAGVRQASRRKSYKAFLESSDSECEEIPIVESFNEKRHTDAATPIRRQITNKKKKIVFDAKKRKSVLKKESVCKIMKSETHRTNTKMGDPGAHDAVCNDENDVNNHKIEDRNAVVHVELDELLNKTGHSDNAESDNASKTHSKIKKTKDIHHAPTESTYAKKKVDKSCKIKKSKKYSSKNLSDPAPLKTKKRNKKKNAYDDLNILKFSEEENPTVDTVLQCNGTEKETESGFPCKRTGENTYLVQAEIHPPPPSLNTLDDIKEVDKENEMLNLQNMQVAVVLEDIFKSNDIGILNLYDKKSLCKKTVSVKVPLSANTSNITVEADSSIEKFRSDEAFEAGNSDLHNDVLLDVIGSGLQDDAVLDSENPRPRRRKEVNYKEPSLHRKMRRC